ncbi:hypothetical protein MKL09_02920 [Methylobacterium sp. J-048]|uniref:hypothetical protein n=1 Tax=Methylobacterium sp. J-048 TaxID=2836635 RepID=UPI001FB960F0|nr:hypothetical protein [Methylobacterium sp. J-048]MCJ2055500.1 hypothetical protein [Methylobacterium sp. J-048]
MGDDVPDDYECGIEWVSDPVQEANGVAFLLASAAYLTLADAHLKREGPAGLVLMNEIEAHITSALQRFVSETPADMARPDIVLMAARKVRALLEAGRSTTRGAGDPH